MAITADLPDVAVTGYNGYTLPPGALTTSYKVTPKLDSARRTVSYCQFDIGLRWWLSPDSASDNATVREQIKDMQAKLMVTGGVLRYDSRGTWPEEVNRSRFKDVAFGPIPGQVHVTSHGPGKAAMVEWSISFALPTCADAVSSGIIEWCYGVSYDLDADRVTSRTVSGHIIVASNRNTPGSRVIADSADAYYEKVIPRMTPNMKPGPIRRRLSEDKSRLDYEFTEHEALGNLPGRGLTSASASEFTRTESEKSLKVHHRTIKGSYTVAPGEAVHRAWDAFFGLFRERVNTIKANNSQATVTVISFESEDPELYGPRQKVNMSITLRIADMNFRQALTQTGLWEPVPGSDWKTWATSVQDVMNPRGPLTLHFNVGKEDVIIDGCRRTAPTSEPATQGMFDAVLRGSRAGEVTKKAIEEITTPPRPEASWMHYEPLVEVYTDPGTIWGTTLPESKGSGSSSSIGSAVGEAAGSAIADMWANQSFWDAGEKGGLPPVVQAVIRAVTAAAVGFKVNTGGTFVQQRTAPVYFIRFRGKALRLGYTIPEPSLTEMDGRAVVPIKSPGTMGNMFSCNAVGNMIHTVYGASWDKWYVCLDPVTFSTLPNPTTATTTADLRGGTLSAADLRSTIRSPR